MNHVDATYLPIINHARIIKDLIYLNGNHTLKFMSSGALVKEDCSQFKH